MEIDGISYKSRFLNCNHHGDDLTVTLWYSPIDQARYKMGQLLAFGSSNPCGFKNNHLVVRSVQLCVSPSGPLDEVVSATDEHDPALGILLDKIRCARGQQH